MDKNKKALLEDFKYDIITKQELREALALLEPESVNLLLAQFKKVNMPYDCEGCQYLVTLNDEPDEAALDEYECTGYAQECPAIT